MKRISILALAALLATLTYSRATTVSFTAAGARQVLDASSSVLTAGDLVWVGTFASTSFAFDPAQTIAQNITAIEAAGGWNQFSLDTSSQTPDSGSTNTVTIGGLAGGGHIVNNIEDDNFGATKADFFNGKLLYVWVFNTTGTDPTQASQMGIFRAGAGASPAWVFPTNTGGDVNNSDALTLGTDATSAPTMVAVGGAGTVLSGGAGNMELVAPTPEPSTLAALIGGAGLLAMVRRRLAK
jgi:hypothetical protein